MFRESVSLLRKGGRSRDFKKTIPRNIQQDKERLYEELSQQKSANNQLLGENQRLKSRIQSLEVGCGYGCVCLGGAGTASGDVAVWGVGGGGEGDSECEEGGGWEHDGYVEEAGEGVAGETGGA